MTPKPWAFDPIVGEAAYVAVAPALEALAAEAVTAPNVDPQGAAMAALQLAAALQKPSRMARFAPARSLLPAGRTPEDLAQQAWALWFLEARLQSSRSSQTTAKVPTKLVEDAYAMRARVIRLLDYYFQDNEAMQAELRAIRLGSGFLDLATDMTKLATHISVHRDVVSKDGVNYREDDEGMLRGMANEILACINEDRFNESSDLRNRAWSLLLITYGDLKAAADFAFRASTSDLAAFPALRSAVMAMGTHRPSSSVEDAATEPLAPTSPAVTPAIGATPQAPVVPFVSGMPGGSPTIG